MYLRERTQCVSIEDCTSENSSLDCGVPQGNLLGPLLFTLYAAPLEDIILEHELECMLSDDTQLYLTTNSAIEDSRKVENCIDSIRVWMTDNRLVLNDDKTEVILFHSRFRKNVDVLKDLRVGVSLIKCQTVVRDFGVYLDSRATMSNHVSKIC